MQCAVCFRATNMGCSLCQKVFYCSRPHQEKHWATHKEECEGRIKNVLASEYNTFSDDAALSRKSSPQTRKFYYSKEKNEEQRSVSKGKEIQLAEKVNKFIENNENRKDQRSRLLLEFTKGKEEQLIARAKNLMIYSESIYKQFDNSFSKVLMEKYKTRTSKYSQQLQCFLDTCFLAKLYLRCGMRQQLKQLLYSLKLPAIPEKVSILNHTDPTELQTYKLWKQEVMNYKTVLSLLASIANAGGFSSYTETIYKNYIYLVERCFGVNQQFLVYFLVGNWYVEIREFNKAKCCFEYCIELKGNDPKEEIIIGDCYFNMSLCLRMMNSLVDSIDKMHHSLIIRRERIGKNSLEAAQCLEFIGKQLMELSRFNQSIDYLNECYSIRKSLLKPNQPAMVNIVQLIKKIYLIIRQRQKKESQRMNIQEVDELQRDMKKVEREFDISKSNEHFFEEFGYQTSQKRKLKDIKLDQQWIEELGTQELESLTQIIRGCESMPYDEAVMYVLQSQFYNSLSEERKQRFKELNPDFRFS